MTTYFIQIYPLVLLFAYSLFKSAANAICILISARVVEVLIMKGGLLSVWEIFVFVNMNNESRWAKTFFIVNVSQNELLSQCMCELRASLLLHGKLLRHSEYISPMKDTKAHDKHICFFGRKYWNSDDESRTRWDVATTRCQNNNN